MKLAKVTLPKGKGGEHSRSSIIRPRPGRRHSDNLVLTLTRYKTQGQQDKLLRRV